MGLGNPSDIDNACIYLLSDTSRWVTGSNLVVDGGKYGEVRFYIWCTRLKGVLIER